MNVLVWNENRHEKSNETVASIYPTGIHGTIKQFLEEENIQVETATLDEENHGITKERLKNTDVLLWWGHLAHHEVSDEVVELIHQRVLAGMGLIVLHSGHFSKIFKKLMGTTCSLRWREQGEKERVWVIEQGHPIAAGLDQYFEIPKTEMYGERFDIPEPDTLVFISWYEGGEVFRSGCCYHRGQGKIFYFAPGHESYPIFYQEEVQKVIKNAVRWAKPVETLSEPVPWDAVPPLEPLA